MGCSRDENHWNFGKGSGMRRNWKEELVIIDVKDIAAILAAYVLEGFGPENCSTRLAMLADMEGDKFYKRISITNGKLITVDVS